MVVSVLALAFLVLIGFIAIVGYKVIFQSRPQGGNDDREACAGCIRKLHAEIPPGA